MSAARMPRRTLAGSAALSGVGLHTGATTRLSCGPSGAWQGGRFRRTDLPDYPDGLAAGEPVLDTERRTVLGQGDCRVETVEHLLAAVAALELDDVLIELDGPEPPIADGSFAPYLELLERAGPCEGPGEPATFTVAAPFTVIE